MKTFETKSFRNYWIVFGLSALTLAVFIQIIGHSFVYYDVEAYITRNPRVRSGLSWQGLIWAFTTFETGDWHPLIWLSYMADMSLFGLSAKAFHGINLILHLANTLLLFVIFNKMSGAVWKSAFIAALFAVHPLHVESVAWAAGRKDLLSTLFWFLATGAYAFYVQTQRRGWFAAVLVLFGLGLMAKPMLVTLPAMLLLLDFWPLNRFGKIPAFRLIAEKLILIPFSLFSSYMAIAAVSFSNSIVSLDSISFAARLNNAVASYFLYLKKTLWPFDLAVYYPHLREDIPLSLAVSASLFLGGMSLWVWRQRNRQSYLIAGWLWFLLTLFPVIGLIQTGSQAMADRYTYVPLVGIFWMAAWGGEALLRQWKLRPAAMGILSFVCVLSFAVIAWDQTSYWKDSIRLNQHALQVTRRNPVAHQNLAYALRREKRFKEAAYHYEQAVKISPSNARLRVLLADIYTELGRLEEAEKMYRTVLAIKPKHTLANISLGHLLTRLGRAEEAKKHLESVSSPLKFEEGPFERTWARWYFGQNRLDEAEKHLRRAIEKNPFDARAHYLMGSLSARKNDPEKAEEWYSKTLQLNPDHAAANNNLGLLLFQKGQAEEALRRFQKAARISPQYVDANLNAGLALAEMGRFEESRLYLEKSLELNPQLKRGHRHLGNVLVRLGKAEKALPHFPLALKGTQEDAAIYLEWGYALKRAKRLEEALKNYREAIRLKPDFAEAHYNLANTLRRLGRKTEAMAYYEKAIAVKPDFLEAKRNLNLLVRELENQA